jgi:hypothetical protein
MPGAIFGEMWEKWCQQPFCRLENTMQEPRAPGKWFLTPFPPIHPAKSGPRAHDDDGSSCDVVFPQYLRPAGSCPHAFEKSSLATVMAVTAFGQPE